MIDDLKESEFFTCFCYKEFSIGSNMSITGITLLLLLLPEVDLHVLNKFEEFGRIGS